jgi:hypothetical protein
MLEPLAPRDKSQAGNVGCLMILAGFLLLIGVGILAVFVIHPEGKGDMWVMPLVGGGFALVGATLMWGGIRGARGLSVPPAELSMEDGVPLVPGARVRVRLRQPGPVAIESIRVKASCDRVYQRPIKPDSSSTVEDSETLWEAVLIESRDERVARGAALERDGVLALPADARPTGPAEPDGRIRWQVEVFTEAGFMRATYRVFDIRVRRVHDDESK